MGLKHGHETGGVSNVAMNSDRDSMEFSIMTYRSYVGHDLNALPFLTNETWGFAQSLMMYDIRAIQQMYGPWFGYNSSNTTYTFSTTTGEMFVDGIGQGTPGDNRIFRTIWDGDGIDTYDFSNYTTNLGINLTPGGWSDLDVGGNFQRAMLNAGYGGVVSYARAHVFNALQYNGDVRSLIENANGGAGNDSIIGNIANNTIYGGNGNDTIDGGDGNDTINGGDGNDLIYLGEGNDFLDSVYLGNDTLYGGNGDDFIYGYISDETYNGEAGNDTLLGWSGNDIINGGAGADSLDGGSGTDTLSYDTSSVAVTVNLTTNIVSGGDATGDIIVANTFENLTGSSYHDVLTGSSGNNTINAGVGIDTVDGESGNDRINGQTGNDILRGSSGNDTINGGSGNDSLTGGVGKDSLTGGNNTDRFVFSGLGNSLLATYDVITDYTTGEQIDAPSSVIPVTLMASSGNVASLTAAAISAVLTTSVFTGNSSKAFTASGFGGSIFLAFNDNIGGFNAATDSIIQLQNYTLGTLTIV
jgi:serralysin